MATRKQQLIRLLGPGIYRNLMKAIHEMRMARKGKVTLHSIEIEKGAPLTPAKRNEIEALFK